MSISPLHRSPVRTIRNGILGLAAVGSLGLAPSLQAQSDNFNSGTLSPYWQGYDSGQILYGALGMPGYTATKTFPADGSGGKALRITIPGDAPFDKSPYGLGPARVLLFRADATYTSAVNRFIQSVDVLAWNNTIDQAFGPSYFIANVGAGSTTGYVFSWEANDYHIRISRIDGETPTHVGVVPNVVLDPTQHYRFVVSSHDGSTFLGQIFNVNDLNNPVAGTIAYDSTYGSPGGYLGLLGYDGGNPSTTGGDVTYDNYSAAKVPTTTTLKATLAHMAPAPGSVDADFYPTISATMLDRDTSTDSSSIMLWLDGALIPQASLNITPYAQESGNPGGAQQMFSGAMVSYQLTSLPAWSSKHTNVLAFADLSGNWMTNTWTWTAAYPMLHATNSLPLGSLSLPGWSVRMVWTNGADLGNSIARAEKQLASPPQIPYLLTTQVVSQVLNWNDAGDGVNAATFGHFFDPTLVSGGARPAAGRFPRQHRVRVLCLPPTHRGGPPLWRNQR